MTNSLAYFMTTYADGPATDPSNGKKIATGNEFVDGLVSIGLPILLLVLVLYSSLKSVKLIQQGKLSLRESSTWIVFNIFIAVSSLYILISKVLAYVGITEFNIFNWVAYYIGVPNTHQQWITFFILMILAFLYVKSFRHTMKISALRESINELAREVAITNGKLLNVSNIKTKKAKVNALTKTALVKAPKKPKAKKEPLNESKNESKG